MRTSWVCIDASLLVPLVLDSSGERIESQLVEWEAEGRQLAAPQLIRYEVCNALYQYEKVGKLNSDLVDEALNSVLALPIELFSDSALHKTAIQMARRFSLPAAYDAHYLVLADRLGAELWTLDKRLALAVGTDFPLVRVWEA